MKPKKFFKQLFNRDKFLPIPTKDCLIPISKFLKNLQESVCLADQIDDIENSQFINDYLVEVPTKNKGINTPPEYETDKIVRRLKTILLLMPNQNLPAGQCHVLELPLISLAARPLKRITQLRIKTSLPLVVNDNDVVCVQLPNINDHSKNATQENKEPSLLTELDLIFNADGNEQRLEEMIKRVEKLGRKQANSINESI